jgi:hypothetical protein
VELGIATALTAGALIAALVHEIPAGAPAMPDPSPEPIAARTPDDSPAIRTPVACDASDIKAVVVHGKIRSFDPDLRATFHMRFADLPSRYAVMTGAEGAFEVRIPREELAGVDLCELPRSGERAAVFQDASMTLEYVLDIER